MAVKLLEPIHPGEILYEEFMKPMGVSINAFAREIAVPPNRISDSTNPMRGFGAGCSPAELFEPEKPKLRNRRKPKTYPPTHSYTATQTRVSFR